MYYQKKLETKLLISGDKITKILLIVGKQMRNLSILGDFNKNRIEHKKTGEV